jgi:hypothetical protein
LREQTRKLNEAAGFCRCCDKANIISSCYVICVKTRAIAA